MINYVVIRKNSENATAIDNGTYGIGACIFRDGLLDILNCVYDISDDEAWLKALADKLNRHGVDPIHLCDIIEDELYNIRT